MKLTMRILFYILLLLLFANCINKSESKNLPLSLAATKPYTPADIGLEPPPPALASLPVISDGERVAIGEMLEYMANNDMMTDTFWKNASKEAKTVLFVEPFSDTALDSEIDARFDGGSFPDGGAPAPLATVLARETTNADEFFNKAAGEFPKMTNDQLIQLRLRLTMSLVVIRLQRDYPDQANGIPDAILTMVRDKTVSFRNLINEELIRRGVTSL